MTTNGKSLHDGTSRDRTRRHPRLSRAWDAARGASQQRVIMLHVDQREDVQQNNSLREADVREPQPGLQAWLCRAQENDVRGRAHRERPLSAAMRCRARGSESFKEQAGL